MTQGLTAVFRNAAEKMNTTADPHELRDLTVLSYLGLRRSVGIIGMLLPVVLVVGNSWLNGGSGFQGSISSYYYSGSMRDVLVGTLCAMAIFLLSYRFSRLDNWAGNLAAIGAVGVAFFPTTPEGGETTWTSRFHLIFAATLFASLAFFCIYLFRKNDRFKTADPTRYEPETDPGKKLRNTIYVVCGVVMIAALLASAFLGFDLFWGETIAVEAFGVAWFVKGENWVGPAGAGWVGRLFQRLTRSVAGGQKAELHSESAGATG